MLKRIVKFDDLMVFLLRNDEVGLIKDKNQKIIVSHSDIAIYSDIKASDSNCNKLFKKILSEKTTQITAPLKNESKRVN